MKGNVLEPAVKRTTLVFTAALLWGVVGIYLFLRGLYYSLPLSGSEYLLLLAALLVGVTKGLLLFKRIIDKNIVRINQLAPHKDKICIFAFQAIQSYLLVTIMISGGHALRLFVTNLTVLFFIYTVIGTALVTGSIIYFKSIKLVVYKN